MTRGMVITRRVTATRCAAAPLRPPGVSLLVPDDDIAAECTLSPASQHGDPADRFLIAAAHERRRAPDAGRAHRRVRQGRACLRAAALSGGDEMSGAVMAHLSCPDERAPGPDQN